MIDDAAKQLFQETVWEYYQAHGRHDLPWRRRTDPYAVMVSELMLQQTQVGRVIPKYEQFMERFPDVKRLAAAPLGNVLRAWNGLGYNRRAKFLWQAARRIAEEHGGLFPGSAEELTALPGIGLNTAGAILAYAYNQPAVFLETNIRTVYIHHFFHDRTGVPDKDIAELVTTTLDREHPREWYWALMDYGAHLKKSIGNLNRHSANYAPQSAFEGSRRQVRGQVLRLLGEEPQTAAALGKHITDNRLPAVLDDLAKEGLITKQGRTYHL